MRRRAAVAKPTRKLQPQRMCAAELGLLRMCSLPIGKTLAGPAETDRTPSFQEPFTDRNPWVRTSGLSLLEESQNRAADVAWRKPASQPPPIGRLRITRRMAGDHRLLVHVERQGAAPLPRTKPHQVFRDYWVSRAARDTPSLPRSIRSVKRASSRGLALAGEDPRSRMRVGLCASLV